MSRRTKDLNRLAVLEVELRTLATALLRNVASGRNTWLFVAEQMNPWPGLPPSREGTDLVERAQAIIRLANHLSEDTSQLVATKILRSFGQANDLSNPNGLGPIRLAASLLKELEAPCQSAV